MKFSTLLKTSVAAACLFAVQTASAGHNCNFIGSDNPKAKTWTLAASCSTDSTIVFPKGVSLKGQGFKITAKDPVGGNFQGPILTNAEAGSTFSIYDLYIRTSTTEFADVCNTGAGRVVGIFMNETAGTINNVNITINKANGASVCEEGVAIRAQGTGNAFRKVKITNSIFNYNQWTAIELVGAVDARVEANQIKGDPDTLGNAMPQRGIVVADLAKAYLLLNNVTRHKQTTLSSNPSFGILLDRSGKSTVFQNTVSNNDVGIAVRSALGVTVKANVIRTSTLDGILLTDILGAPLTGPAVSGNVIWANDSQKNKGNGIYLQDTQGLTIKNTIKNNITRENQDGIRVEGSLNKIQVNTSNSNNAAGGFFDIRDAGIAVQEVKNRYTMNSCNTSSAVYPVKIDCPAP